MLILMAIVGAIFYTYNQRQRENLSHDISVMKNEFFSDASHRLRTPLTLIVFRATTKPALPFSATLKTQAEPRAVTNSRTQCEGDAGNDQQDVEI